MAKRNTAANFWERVDRFGPAGCWLWLGHRSTRGYGQLAWHGRLQRAHRVAYELTRGPVPSGLIVLHRCDRRECVNPDHLTVGTQTDNVRDMDAKGRRTVLRGDDVGTARLTTEQVLSIRAQHEAGISYRLLARQHRVSKSLISQICTGLIWRHVLAGNT